MRLVALFVLAMAALPASAASGEYFDLFNGKTLDGWVAEGDKEYEQDGKKLPVWVAGDGMLTCMVNTNKSYGFLRYAKQEFADFTLHLEYRMTPREKPTATRCNSGVGIRTVPFDAKNSGKTRPSAAAYEVQLLDDADAPLDKHSTASLYNYVAPKFNAVKAAPEWNVMDIECVGQRIKITLNDKEVLNVDQSEIKEIKDKPLKGFICLQNHGGRVDFKNIKVREIKP